MSEQDANTDGGRLEFSITIMNREFDSHSLRHYTVLLCIRLFESTAKTTSSAAKDVAASAAMLPLVTAQTVALARGFGGRIFCDGEHMPGKLKPLDVERETRPGKYPDGEGLYLVIASATSKNWSYRYWKDGKQRWLGLGSVKDVSLCTPRTTPYVDRRRTSARRWVRGHRERGR